MKRRSFFRALLACVMALAMVPQMVFAGTWYLEDGDILVVARDGTQYVSQAGQTQEDGDTVITQYDSTVATEHTVTLESQGRSVASILLQDVYMIGCGTMIDVTNGSSARIELEGENRLESGELQEDLSPPEAPIHVGSGSLTITGDGALEMEVESSGAKIGSDEYEDFTGTIHITGEAVISTDDDGSADGAGIGSGQYGDFVGTVKIDGDAEVSVESNDRGAGIGTGEKGDFRGRVEIGGSATVYAEGDDDSAGIGSGENCSFSGGTILIGGNATVYAEGDDEGPAIGAADDTPMNGTVIIRDNATVYTEPGSECQADIGAEGSDAGTGTIRIEGRAKVYSQDDNTLRLGAADDEAEGGIGIYLGEDVTLNGVTGARILAGQGGDQVQISSPAGAQSAKAIYAGPPMNWIKVEKTQHGTVRCGPLAVSEGARITLRPVAEEGYTLDTVKVRAARDGRILTLEELSFEMPLGGVTVIATFKPVQ